MIEPAAGLTRSLMAFLVDAYTEDEAPNTKGGVDKRTVLRLDPRLAPVKAAVLPLSRNEALSPKARDLAAELRKNWNVDFDDAEAIGRRYRRQDEIGTPFCVTVDFDTLDDDAVTIRERDTMTPGAGRPGQGPRLPRRPPGRLLSWLDSARQVVLGCHVAGNLHPSALTSRGGTRGSAVVLAALVETPVVLAPMAGITNAAYRQLCREQAEAVCRWTRPGCSSAR